MTAASRRAGLDVHVYPSALEYSTRILKMTETLVSRGIVDRVLVVGTSKEGLPDRERIDDSRGILRVNTSLRGERLVPKALQLLEWSARIFLRLRREPVDMVNCHTLSSFPLCALLSWWHDAILVYEPHELETETDVSTGVRRRIGKWIEGFLVRRADTVIVVSESIAEHYRRDYGLPNVHVILNAPELESGAAAAAPAPLRASLGIPPGDIVFMYSGVLAETRGVRLLLDAFARVPHDRHIVFLGFGPLEDEIRAAVAASPNIHFHSAVPSSDVVRYTRDADVGFALLADICVNHRCALPNKFFHYLHAGLPVVASDMDEMGRIVDAYRCGWRVSWSAERMAAIVTSIDAAQVQAMRAGAGRAKADMNWTNEARKLASVYRDLPAPRGRPSGAAWRPVSGGSR